MTDAMTDALIGAFASANKKPAEVGGLFISAERH
jgi:hypothetical protein